MLAAHPLLHDVHVAPDGVAWAAVDALDDLQRRCWLAGHFDRSSAVHCHDVLSKRD